MSCLVYLDKEKLASLEFILKARVFGSYLAKRGLVYCIVCYLAYSNLLSLIQSLYHFYQKMTLLGRIIAT